MVDFELNKKEEKEETNPSETTVTKRKKETIDVPKIRELEGKIDTIMMVFGDFQTKLLNSTSILIDNFNQLKNYFRKGTFDILDLVAIAFGTAIAYFILLTTSKRREIA